MEPLRFFGIIKLTMLIILRNWNHFLCIALVLALPSALNLLVSDSSASIKVLLANVSYLFKQLFSDDASSAAPGTDGSAFDKERHPHALGLQLAVGAFSLAVSLTSTPLVTFSTCRACLNMRVTLEGSARGIQRAIGKLIVTTLCVMTVFVGAFAVAAVGVGVIVGVGAAMGGGRATTVMAVAGGIATVGMLVFIVAGLSLAGTVAILEEANGWDAIRRSMYLVRQRKGATAGLFLLLWLCGMLPLPVLAADSWIAKGAGLGVEAFIYLFSMVAIVVLYMSCRASLQEPLNFLVANCDRFGPVDSSQAKYLDPQTASKITAADYA